MVTQTAPAGGKNATAMVRPFIVGSRYADDFSYDESQALGAATVKLPVYNLDTDGYTARLYILAECTGAGNASVTAAFNEDAPFDVFQDIHLDDTNSKPILGPMTGHDLYLANKYGGYAFVSDMKASPVYSVTSGTGSTQGSFTFVLPVPIEIAHRDALGSLTNKSASSVFKLHLTLNTLAAVYSSSPATSATLRVRIAQFGWMNSDGIDSKGNPTSPNPPATNTVQFWDKETYPFSSGAMTWQPSSFTGGLRTMILILRDADGSRTANAGDFPDPMTFNVDKTTLFNRLRNIWLHLIGEHWNRFNGVEVVPGVSGTPATEGLKKDYGVFPESWARDFGLQPGDESRFGYLWVSAATALVFKGTVGSGSASHTFTLLRNYVNPANGDPRTMTPGNR